MIFESLRYYAKEKLTQNTINKPLTKKVSSLGAKRF